MFTDFARVWTPVLLERSLSNRPKAIQLASEHVWLRRSDDGDVMAYHNRHTDPRSPQGALTFPTHVAGGLVWMYTEPASKTFPPPPHVPGCLRDAKRNLFALEVTWGTHWTRVLENMMDNTHLTFVHRDTLGRRLARSVGPRSRIDVRIDDAPEGFFVAGVMDDHLYSGVHQFLPPNGVAIYMQLEGAPVSTDLNMARRAHVYCIPVHERATRLLIVSHFGPWNYVARFFLPVNRYIVQQDRAIVESSQPPEVPPPGVEKSVASDRATLRFRRYYYDTLKDSCARAFADVRSQPSSVR